jgi:peptidoglycan/LPS O-acetylase OafA/YrhL
VAPPPGHLRFPLLDSIRGLAVLVVIAFHVSSITGALGVGVFGEALAVLGVVAIVLFFLMSAFLLYRPFVVAHAAGRPRPSARRFGRRRLLRVVPGYWVALTLLAIFPGIVGVFSDDWWRYYFFAQTYSQETYGQGIPVAWTLCVEVTFYLAIPICAIAVRRLHFGSGSRAWLRAELGALAVVAAGGVAVQIAARRQEVSNIVGESLLGQAPWFALGMALAAITVAIQRGELDSRAIRALAAHPALCWTAALVPYAVLTLLQPPGGLAGIIGALNTPQPSPRAAATIALTAVMAFLLVAPAMFGKPGEGLLRRTLGAAPLAWLGLVSYAFYLYHLTVAQVLGVSADPLHFSGSGLGLVDKISFATTPILFALTVAVSAALAAASYYIVELPFLRRKEG